MRTVSAFIASLLLALTVGGCYDPPPVPRDKPLACTGTEPGQCPIGYSCFAKRFCALQSCTVDEDCPFGLICSPTKGACALPAGGDGGADGGDGGMEGEADGGVLGANPTFDAAVLFDAPVDVALTIDVAGPEAHTPTFDSGFADLAEGNI